LRLDTGFRCWDDVWDWVLDLDTDFRYVFE
jgi:hypothetical protein